MGLVSLDPIEKRVSNITSELDSILEKNKTVFQGKGKLNDFKLKLHINNSVVPCAQTTRKVPYHLRKKVIEKIKKLEELDIIEEADGPPHWVSPVIATPKKDRDIRIVIDMRKANQAIKRKRHPIPTLEQFKQEMHGAVMFSKLNLKMGYHQLELDERSRPITTSATPIGLRRYKRLSLGVTSASECYQHTLEQYDLTGARNISDDIIVWGKTEKEHHENLKAVLQRNKEMGWRLKKICEFAKSTITFFGIVLSKEGVKADPLKIQAIDNMKVPENEQELKSFLGLITYFCIYSKFLRQSGVVKKTFEKGKQFCMGTHHTI